MYINILIFNNGTYSNLTIIIFIEIVNKITTIHTNNINNYLKIIILFKNNS